MCRRPPARVPRREAQRRHATAIRRCRPHEAAVVEDGGERPARRVHQHVHDLRHHFPDGPLTSRPSTRSAVPSVYELAARPAPSAATARPRLRREKRVDGGDGNKDGGEQDAAEDRDRPPPAVPPLERLRWRGGVGRARHAASGDVHGPPISSQPGDKPSTSARQDRSRPTRPAASNPGRVRWARQLVPPTSGAATARMDRRRRH